MYLLFLSKSCEIVLVTFLGVVPREDEWVVKIGCDETRTPASAANQWYRLGKLERSKNNNR